jgi:hypothetical protein
MLGGITPAFHINCVEYNMLECSCRHVTQVEQVSTRLPLEPCLDVFLIGSSCLEETGRTVDGVAREAETVGGHVFDVIRVAGLDVVTMEEGGISATTLCPVGRKGLIVGKAKVFGALFDPLDCSRYTMSVSSLLVLYEMCSPLYLFFW